MMTKRLRTCTTCGTALRAGQIRPVGTFSCPACGARLEAASSYLWWAGLVNVAVCAATFWGLGLRGVYLGLAVALAHFPVQRLTLARLARIIPPTVRPAPPPKAISQVLRERNGPVSLNLDDRKRR